MQIKTKLLFAPLTVVTQKNNWREHLKNVLIEYDAESQTLTVAGTDAVVMIINRMRITDAESAAFLAKVFSESDQGYKLPATILKEKSLTIDLDLIDGRIVCNGTIVEKFNGTMPNFMNVVPKKLAYAQYYTAFDPDYIKLINKAMGYKGADSIIDRLPFVGQDDQEEGAVHESQSVHAWKVQDTMDDIDTLILLMPRKIQRG